MSNEYVFHFFFVKKLGISERNLQMFCEIISGVTKKDQ